MPKLLERALWLVVLSLMLNLLFVYAHSEFFVDPSNAELRSNSYQNPIWSDFQKAKPNDQVSLRATMFATFRGEGYQGQSTMIEAYADIYGCNGSSCSYISRSPTGQDWLTANQWTSPPMQWDNILAVSGDYERYEFQVHAKTQNTDYSQNPSTSATLTVVKDKSYCSQLELTTHSITINENTTYNDYFTVQNASDEEFVVDNISISSNDPVMSFSMGSKPNRLYSGQTANINFSASSGSVGSSAYGTGTAWMSGRFADSGVQCWLSAFDRQEQTFTFQVRDTSASNPGKCSQIISTPYTLYIDEGQTQSFGISVHNDSNEDLSNVVMGVTDDSQAFGASIDPNSTFTKLREGETRSIGITISAGNVSYTQSGTAYAVIEGDFLDSSEACRGDKIEIPVSVVVRNTSGNSDCNHISVNADNLQINENATKTFSMGVSNSDERGFYIDELQVYDYSSIFDLSAIDRPGLVGGKSSAAFNASISSFTVSGDTSGTAYVKLKGHFSDSQKCDYFDVPEKSFTVTVKNSGNASTSCKQLTLQPYPVVAKANSIATQNFYLQNNSGQTFYIDNASIYDSEQYFDAQADSYDSFALAGSNAVVKARVSSSSPSSTINGLGYFQVRGHFADNTYCSYSDIGTQSFNVRVESQGAGASCSNFSISVPTELGTSGKTLLEFSYNNPTSQDAILTLRAQNTSIDKTSFVLPANSSQTLSTYVTMSGSGTDLIEYSTTSTSATGCVIPSRFTTLRAGTATLSGGVQIERYPYPIVLQGNEFDVQVAVSSNSGSTESIVLGLEGIPSDWQTQSSTVVLQPYEKNREVQLHVKVASLEYSGSVRLSMQTSSETFSRILAVQPKSGKAGITLTASVSQRLDLNGLDVKAVVTNNSGTKQSGSIALTLPSGWTWSGDNSISLEPGQQKQVSLTVKPAGAITQDQEIGVKFVPSSGSGQEVSTNIKANPSVPLLPSALAGLGASLWLGILALVIIALIAFAYFELRKTPEIRAKKVEPMPEKPGAAKAKKRKGASDAIFNDRAYNAATMAYFGAKKELKKKKGKKK